MSILFTVLLTAGAVSAPQLDATTLTLSAPTTVVELDVGKLKGDLSRLAWSPDARQLYVQTAERDRSGVLARHYVLDLDGRPPRSIDEEPSWAIEYWFWKAAQAAPGLSTFKIEVEQQQKRVTATSTPMGGEMARGAPSTGSGTGSDQSVRTFDQAQMNNVFTLRLKGEVVGESVNSPAQPGLTFGWGPAGTGLIAFANRDGRLVVMDDQGRKQEVGSSKAVLLPAWTEDGQRVAYLEKTGRKKFVLKVIDVKRPVS